MSNNTLAKLFNYTIVSLSLLLIICIFINSLRNVIFPLVVSWGLIYSIAGIWQVLTHFDTGLGSAPNFGLGRLGKSYQRNPKWVKYNGFIAVIIGLTVIILSVYFKYFGH